MFHSKYKRKNSRYVLEVFVELCVESFVRSERCLPSYTHRAIKIKICIKNLMVVLVAAKKNFQEYPKPLSEVSKSQVGELAVVVDQRKK